MSREHFDDCTMPRLKAFQGSRGDLMQRCRTCGRVSVAPAVVEPMLSGRSSWYAQDGADSPPEPVLEDHGRYWLGCCRCGASIWCRSQKPRVPLCPRCRNRRPDRSPEGAAA